MANYLLSYEPEMFQALNSFGTTYILKCLKISWWGLRKRKFEIKYEIPWNANSKAFWDKWDDLIINKKSFK